MGAIKDILWDSPIAQFETLTGKDLRRKDKAARNPYKNLAGKGANMSPKQRAEFLARQKAKGESMDSQGNSTRTTNTPLTDRYS